MGDRRSGGLGACALGGAAAVGRATGRAVDRRKQLKFRLFRHWFHRRKISLDGNVDVRSVTQQHRRTTLFHRIDDDGGGGGGDHLLR